jgi:cytochrome c oxidase subunit 2
MFNEFLKVNAAAPLQVGFQKPATTVMEGIIFFHDDLFVFLTFICVFVLYILWMCIVLFKDAKIANKFVHASTLEVIWTVIPALILIIIAIPSFSLLYSIDEVIEPLFTFKAIGHQWYWTYELIDSESLQTLFSKHLKTSENVETSFSALSTEGFDSYLVPEDELKGGKRLLVVDNHLVIPTRVPTRILVSSADVLHSWAVPSLGLKLDACPGRINQTSVTIEDTGIFYGQCSEICGVNHGFMPIGIVAMEFADKYTSAMFSRDLVSTLEAMIAGLVVVLNEAESK